MPQCFPVISCYVIFAWRSARSTSISLMSFSLRLQSPAGAVSSIWAGLRAPTTAAVTSARRRTQLIANRPGPQADGRQLQIRIAQLPCLHSRTPRNRISPIGYYGSRNLSILLCFYAEGHMEHLKNDYGAVEKHQMALSPHYPQLHNVYFHVIARRPKADVAISKCYLRAFSIAPLSVFVFLCRAKEPL